jgi:hypothetical protein
MTVTCWGPGEHTKNIRIRRKKGEILKELGSCHILNEDYCYLYDLPQWKELALVLWRLSIYVLFL